VLTAAAQAVKMGRGTLLTPRESWTAEVWGHYDELGEFRFAIDWRANMISRVRLRAARVRSDRDEPEIVNSGPAVDLVAELAGDIGGRSQLLATLATLLDVPGEGFLVGEQRADADGVEWTAKSADEIRRYGGGGRRTRDGVRSNIQVIDEETSAAKGSEAWRELTGEFYVTRIWRPHKRLHYRADSAARAARGTMRELELVNRRIVAQYLSRLASAGVFIVPDEATFPVRPEFQDEPDPFVSEWIETAKEAINTPGTAAAVVPIPMRVPAELVEKFKFIDFTLAADDTLIAKRESAVRRLATQLDIPAEIVLGMGDINHWGQWQIEEGAIKVHILPPVELICYGLTSGFLIPQLKALGEDPDTWVVWYDASEIVHRPDRSAMAKDAYDRYELSGTAYRRESGFDEDDAPAGDDLSKQILKFAARQPVLVYAALEDLTGTSGEGTPSPATGTGGPTQVPPTTQPDRSPPAPQDAESADATRSAQLAASRLRLLELSDDKFNQHTIEFTLDGWFVHHVESCAAQPHRCPVTWAAHEHIGVAPGLTGRYRVRSNSSGQLVIGERDLTATNGRSTSWVR
jgi:hypothetical protein